MPSHDHVALSALAADAYVYGFPQVADLTAVERLLHEGLGAVPPVRLNGFGHADRLAGPETDFVSVNNDTLYSVAPLDLSEGPQLLRVPDTAGAYYVLQFVDAWTNSFCYLGRRAFGTGEQTWLVVPPGWHGTPPDGVRVISAPTTVATIVGRFACDGPADLPRVAALQQHLTLTALEPGGLPAGLPKPDPAVPEELRFFERLRLWMAAFPPAAPDVEYQQRFAPLGLLDAGASPYLAADPGWAAVLAHGLETGRERIEAATRAPEPADDRPVGEWQTNLHLFDYNLDFQGPGTVDDPQWRIPDRRAAYLTRAVAARSGLWGNHAYEAVYAGCYDDAEGRPLTGAHAYTLRFDSPPPVDAFWSVTMYALPDYRLVANPIDRYSIGDRTPGLVHGDDGSLTLHLRHERPTDPAEAANWLPTPQGGFRPLIRLYQPQPAVLQGSYRLPPIESVGGL
ncbi:hypothetical protein P3T36_003246 [Kitasatospora sp. MAP12-15]|uniref:DUF1254 domain-containing protein n=1 Tax=unclassified Kitasatospora TaxID=2633591 RepID=UPI002475737C|nr:DUF1254 domain-containing protein [Kitasatospora sp. MAP12-44]MDH6111222.1 hypothetical protein [Kitasatospora sp. MAP12-44]